MAIGATLSVILLKRLEMNAIGFLIQQNVALKILVVISKISKKHFCSGQEYLNLIEQI